MVVIRLLFTTPVILFIFRYNSLHSFIAAASSGTSCLVYFVTSHLFTKYRIMMRLLYGYKRWDINIYQFTPMDLKRNKLLLLLLILLFLDRSSLCLWYKSQWTVTINTSIYWFLLIQITLLHVSIIFWIILRLEYLKKKNITIAILLYG